MTGRAVFLDRDGVLNRAVVRGGRPYSPHRVEDVAILPGAPEALAALRLEGYRLIVVTNQPDIARGAVSAEAVAAIHDYLRGNLPLDDIVVCPHDDADSCPCRKPKPGMLLRSADVWQVSPVASYMVGDRWRDIEAGRRAGCRVVLVDYGYDEPLHSEPDRRVASLVEAASWILAQDRERGKQL